MGGQIQSKYSAHRQLWQLSERELETMRRDLHLFYGQQLPMLFGDIRQYAADLDTAHRGIHISKIAGSAGSIVGGILSIVGFGLSFVTFGASSVLIIIGSVIGGAGGATVGGASIADAVKSRKTKIMAKEKFKKCMEAQKRLVALSECIAKHLEHVESRFSFKEFQERFNICRHSACGVYGTGKGVLVDMVYNPITTGLRMSKFADIAADATSPGLTLFRSLGKTARGASIASVVLGAVFLPVDIYTLISSSIVIHKRKGHSVSNRLREIVEKMEKNCPTKESIDYMIDSTILCLRNAQCME